MRNKLLENLNAWHVVNHNKDVYYGETMCHACNKETVNYCVSQFGWFVCEKCAIFFTLDGYRVEK